MSTNFLRIFFFSLVTDCAFSFRQDDLEDYFDDFKSKIESASNKNVRKNAIAYLVNEVWRLKLNFKYIKCISHTKSMKNPHTAFEIEELEKILHYTLHERKNHKMYCVILTLFKIAGRVQDAAFLTFG